MNKRMLRGYVSFVITLCMIFSSFITAGAVPSVSPSEYLSQQQDDNDTIDEQEDLFTLAMSKSVIDMGDAKDSVKLSVWVNSQALDKGPIDNITYYADGKEIGKGNKINYRPAESALHFIDNEATLHIFAVCKYEDGTGDKTNIEELKVLKASSEVVKEDFSIVLSKSEINMADEDDAVDISFKINSYDMEKGPITDITYYADGKEIGTGKKVTFRPDEDMLHFMDGKATLNIFAVCKHSDGTGNRTNVEKITVIEATGEVVEDFKINLSKDELDLNEEDSIDVSVKINAYDASKGLIQDITYYANGKEIGKGRKIEFAPSEDMLHFMDGKATLSIFAVCKYADGTGNRTNIETLTVLEATGEVSKEEFTINVSSNELDLNKDESVDLFVTMKGLNPEKGPIKEITYYANGKEIGTGRSMTFTPSEDMLHFMNGKATLSLFAVCKYGDGTGNRTNIETLTVLEGNSGDVDTEEFTVNLSSDELDLAKDDSINVSVSMKGLNPEKGPIKEITYYANGKVIGQGMRITFTPSEDMLHFTDGKATLSIFAVCKYGDGTGNRTNIATLTVLEDNGQVDTDKEVFTINLSKDELDLSEEESVDLSVTMKGLNAEKGPIKDIRYYADGKEIGVGRTVTFTPSEDMLHFVDGVATLNIFAVCKYGDGTGNRTNVAKLTILEGAGTQTPDKEEFTINVSQDELDLSQEESVDLSVSMKGLNPEKGPIKEITYYANGTAIGTGRSMTFAPSEDILHFMDGKATLSLFAVCKYGDGTGNRTNIATLTVYEGTGSETPAKEEFKLNTSLEELDLSQEDSVELSVSMKGLNPEKGPIKEITYYANGKEIGTGRSMTYKPSEDELHFMDGKATLSLFAVCKYGDGTGNRTNIVTLTVLEGTGSETPDKEEFTLNASTKELDLSEADSVDLSVTMKGLNPAKGPIKEITYYANGTEIGTGRSLKFSPSEDILHFMDGKATLSLFAVCKYGDGTGNKTNIVTLTVLEGTGSETPDKEVFTLNVSDKELDLSEANSVDLSVSMKGLNPEKGPIKEITYYANGTEIGTGRSLKFSPSEDILHFMDGKATLSLFAVCKYGDGTGNRTNIVTLTVLEGTGSETPDKEVFTINLSSDELDLAKKDSVDLSVTMKGLNTDKGPIKEITYYADGKEIGTGRSLKFSPSEDMLHFTDGVAKLNIFAVCKYGDGTGNRTNIAVLKVLADTSADDPDDDSFKIKLSKKEMNYDESVNLSVVMGAIDVTKGPIKTITYYANGVEVGSGKSYTFKPGDYGLPFEDGETTLIINAVCAYGDGTEVSTNDAYLTVYEVTGTTTSEDDFRINLSSDVLDLSETDSINLSVMINAYDTTKGSISDITYYANGFEVGKGIRTKFTPSDDLLHFVNGEATLSIFAVCKYADGSGSRTDIATLKVLEGNTVQPPVKVESDLELSVSGETGNTSSVNKKFTITNTGSKDIDLSRIKLRYYYTKDSSVSQNLFCDNAAMNLNVAPWYVDAAQYVQSKFVNVSGDSYYVEISFRNGAPSLPGNNKIELQTRLTNADWSVMNQSNDYSNKGADYVVMTLDDELVWGTAPSN